MDGQIEGGNVEGCIKFKLFMNRSILHLVLTLSVMTSILKLMQLCNFVHTFYKCT